MTNKTSSLASFVVVAVLASGGCTADDGAPAAEAETGPVDTDAGPSDMPEDERPQYECAPDQLDACPPDTKCTAVAAPDGHSYGFECVMDKGELGPGDLCMPSPPTGVDGCPSGFACIPDTTNIPSEGHCLPLCLDDQGCLDGLCSARPTSPIRVCAELCNPLLVSCPETHACRLLEDRAFGCVIPMPDDIGVQGAACDGINQLGCANGFVCRNSFDVHDCFDSDYCCTAVCAIDEHQCPAQTTCRPFALEQPGLGKLGVCTL